ncbi:hypothetical protein [Pseudonocardia sp. HH130630-07]|uniref:hypothetical protein n=1 Tax=Pseudonocardia sp. HH130630-07 TaxID=1690815 RepID=UPI0018D30B62|nr:hypothetical protein [Pseudonocardia sp. HH130630-07]
MQRQGTKFTLSILGNHQIAGLANFESPETAGAFAAEVAQTVEKYGPDGVELDDEHSDYDGPGAPPINPDSAGWLISALRAHLPDKIISFYDIGPATEGLSQATSQSARSWTTPGTSTTGRTRRRPSPGSPGNSSPRRP